jgi:predicted lipoprotein with Yx(FWY)xxD motif
MPKVFAPIFPMLLLLLLLCAAATARADVYKWVDAKGVVHYTDNKDEAGEAAVQELRVGGPPPQAATGPTWQQREDEFKRQQQHKLMAPGYKPRTAAAVTPAAQSLYSGDKPVTDASRCAMARDVKKGVLHHVNGMPIDQHDRDTADSDIRSYCR